MTLKEQILELRASGKTYDEIKKELGCSKGTIAYYCNSTTKDKASICRKKNRSLQHPFSKKIESFCVIATFSKREPTHKTRKLLELKCQCFSRIKGNSMYQKPSFTVDDVIAKFGENPVCYLTGKPIDIEQPRTYQFDHRIPRSRGGDNSLDNLELASTEANQAKRDMTPDELFNFCKSVLEHQGYKVEKAPSTGVGPVCNSCELPTD